MLLNKLNIKIFKLKILIVFLQNGKNMIIISFLKKFK